MTASKHPALRGLSVLLLPCALGILLAGCATQEEIISNQETLLSAAGFVIKPVNTPERQTSLTTLPPNRIVMQPSGDKMTFLYADPVVCKCLFVGDQPSFSRYQQMTFQQRLANQAQSTALAYQSASFGWGPWGGGPWGWGWGGGMWGPGWGW
ncbi:hypothetical protein [Granulibacter bethesdensis]|uniref:Lipoprotein n=1 Tax=Granulibacter bethesdensis TaxID=364410 RepID=A0AAN0RDN6_9PROT|nr:hypothetical protein [Granulibacter bethesdensis]AHJ62902.1 Hypothetical protein GbCGDNIH3_1086 [Granulibacter bethesdensis]AHJ66529.1 Hypothetical protein GbCGDNIH4_1086 [Granulibacter bethesdensis CGDNIH4]APH59425.1 Hypothetical protein GbCGDNIH7_1086 [Granulibacter bethesdensis]